MTGFSKTMLGLSAAIGVLAVATGAWAQTRAFDVPSEEAAKSIPEFARQAGIQITAPVSQLHGVKTPALQGQFDVRAALARLLQGTDLVVASDTGGTIVLRRAEVGPPPAGPAPTSADETTVSEVVVTGSRIHGARPTGSELIELTRASLTSQGYTTLDDAMRNLTQQVNAGPNQYTATFGSAGGTQLASSNHTGGTAVNLRGLGSNTTLLLIDGQRLAASGAASNFYDVSIIPIAAIDRVEILADGASAVYGSDAVGGVVNVVLRKDFTGAETSVDYGAGDRFWRYSVDQVAGAAWSGGHIIASYEHLEQSNLSAASRAYVRADLAPFGGTDQRSAYYGEPGTISVGGKTYAIPAGQSGVGLSSASLVPGTSNRDEVYPYLDLVPSKTQDTVMATVSQDVTSNFELFGQAFGSFRDTTQNLTPYRGVLTVPKSNAFWVSPSPTAASESVYYSFDRELGPEREKGDQKDWGFSGGGRLHLPMQWTAEAYAAFSAEDLSEMVANFVNSYYLNKALASSSPATAFNPFGDGSANSAAVVKSLEGFQTYSYRTLSESVNVQADGPIFHLPAGDVKLAIGGESRREDLHQNDELFTSTATPTSSPTGLIDRSRTVNAAFAEINIPIVSPEQNLGWIRRLTLSAAGRTESYSDVGGTSNPRVGVDLTLPEDVKLRASYGTSFDAPLLIQMAASPINGLITTVADPKSPTGQSTVILRSGNDPNLKPETATTWSAGASWTPHQFEGFKIEINYFNIDFTNRIGSPPNYTVMLEQEGIYTSLITRNPTAAQVNALQNAPGFGSTPVNPSTVAAILDIRTENEAKQQMDGFDLSASLTRRAFGGRMSLAFNGTRIINDKIALDQTAPLVQFVDNAFYPTSWKTRSALTWERDGLMLAGYLNWQNGYKFAITTGAEPVHAFTTVDLSANVDLGRLGFHTLRGTKLTVAVENLFDADPPFLNASGGYDPINANALGRFTSVRLTHDW